MASAKDQLRERMLLFLENLEHDGGIGHQGDIPDFDYYALDYLDFAELNLRRYDATTAERERENELISCVSNLKRALDCQIECFLSSWNIRGAVKKRNLGLEAKLRFLADVGFFSSRTIGRFTTLRNRIEHDFQRPDVKDLEALFDLVSAFVAILQTPLTSGFSDELDFQILSRNRKHREGLFSLTYKRDERKFVAEWSLDAKPEEAGSTEAPFSSPEDFAYFFRVLLLLNQLESFASFDHIRARLKA